MYAKAMWSRLPWQRAQNWGCSGLAGLLKARRPVLINASDPDKPIKATDFSRHEGVEYFYLINLQQPNNFLK